MLGGLYAVREGLYLSAADAILTACGRPRVGKPKSERHHWWPVCLSRYWAGDDGGVSKISANGVELRIRPAGFGVIGNGHFIKLGRMPGETTGWDQNFESEFQRADENIPRLIAFLEAMTFEVRSHASLRDRFVAGVIPDDFFDQLIETLISLAVRSPMTREAVVGIAERLRGALPERERNCIMALNMRDMHKTAFQTLRGRGKVAVISSPDREFVFGDGFYHNLTSVVAPPMNARILAPLTPRIAVLYAVPMRYSVEPKVSTLVINSDEATTLNQVVQVYARDAIFFRSEKPDISTEFSKGSHLQYNSSRNLVEEIVCRMPGVPSRDTSLDWLEDKIDGHN
jgi:hypothetical protein